MPELYEIRAGYDWGTIVVYQAHSDAIADTAVAAQRFVPPFSLTRMTWIKPSFLWMMERSGWRRKPGQERVLAVRITRAGWEEALASAVLTSPETRVYPDAEEWRRQFAQARVHVQWDPERSLRGEKLPFRSIQVGLSRHIVEMYVNEWTVEIKDMTPLVRKLYGLIQSGDAARAKELLPKEKVYPMPTEIARWIGL
ncbi:MAG: DUF4291 domain-containing protein [Armatimonadetes bacterium]|nr:DUF4291 domain-containing protein [Armatimonadota bacterium]